MASKLAQEPEEIDKGIARIEVDVRPDHTGDRVLTFLVVLNENMEPANASLKTGRRLLGIASKLRRRAAELGVPLFAYVRFLREADMEARQQTA